MILRMILAVLLICASPMTWALGWVGNDLYGVPCHGLGQGFGPYDYNHPPSKAALYVVESHHFTRSVQQLDENHSDNHTSLIGNLDYTLRAFPNHPRALWAMIRLYLRHGRPNNPQSEYPPAECYLQRAIAFRPKDAVLYMLYGIYLHLAGMPDKAVPYYKKSLRLDPDSAEAQYNFGLLLVDQKKYTEALRHARKAYALGYPLPGLRERLRKAGHPLGERNAHKKDSASK